MSIAATILLMAGTCVCFGGESDDLIRLTPVSKGGMAKVGYYMPNRAEFAGSNVRDCLSETHQGPARLWRIVPRPQLPRDRRRGDAQPRRGRPGWHQGRLDHAGFPGRGSTGNGTLDRSGTGPPGPRSAPLRSDGLAARGVYWLMPTRAVPTRYAAWHILIDTSIRRRQDAGINSRTSAVERT